MNRPERSCEYGFETTRKPARPAMPSWCRSIVNNGPIHHLKNTGPWAERFFKISVIGRLWNKIIWPVAEKFPLLIYFEGDVYFRCWNLKWGLEYYIWTIHTLNKWTSIITIMLIYSKNRRMGYRRKAETSILLMEFLQKSFRARYLFRYQSGNSERGLSNYNFLSLRSPGMP